MDYCISGLAQRLRTGMTGGHEDTRKWVFIRTVQQINGWQDRPQTFSARVPPV